MLGAVALSLALAAVLSYLVLELPRVSISAAQVETPPPFTARTG
jgi:hypothetical protein